MKAILIITDSTNGNTISTNEYNSLKEARSHLYNSGWIRSGLKSVETYYGCVNAVIGYTDATAHLVSKKDWEKLYQFMY